VLPRFTHLDEPGFPGRSLVKACVAVIPTSGGLVKVCEHPHGEKFEQWIGPPPDPGGLMSVGRLMWMLAKPTSGREVLQFVLCMVAQSPTTGSV